MSNELYIYTGGRGGATRQLHYTFTDLLRAAEFSCKVNGKIVPMLDYFEGHFRPVYAVWFECIEAEYKEVPDEV